MKRSTATALAALLALLPSIGVFNQGTAQALEAGTPPARVVSLDLCSDWMLLRMAQRSQLAALSPMVARYPGEWEVDGVATHNGTLEQIIDLEPDLIIAGEHNAITLRQRLQRLGFPVAVLPLPQTLEAIDDYEGRFRTLLGLPLMETGRAERIEPAVEAERPRLLLLGANAIGTGRDTFEDAIIKEAGWRNYLSEKGYRTLDLEQLIVDPPDAVLWSAPHSAALASNFSQHKALRRAVPAARWLSTDYWHWQCPGPWSRSLIRELQQWLPH